MLHRTFVTHTVIIFSFFEIIHKVLKLWDSSSQMFESSLLGHKKHMHVEPK